MLNIFREILHELREIHGAIVRLGENMALDFSKLQAADAALAAEVQTLTQTITDESAKIQAAIDALANASGSDAANQAVIDGVTADLTDSNSKLTAAAASVQGLPTSPSAPAPPAPTS